MKKYVMLLIALTALFISARADTVYDEVQGKTVQFDVTHNGAGQFTYQWKKDGANIPGATTKTLTIVDIKATDAGSYSVQVTNKAGTVLSDKGIFTVTVNPTTATVTVKTL